MSSSDGLLWGLVLRWWVDEAKLLLLVFVGHHLAWLVSVKVFSKVITGRERRTYDVMPSVWK